jgi:DNA-binding SARP family transcriptional activator
LWPAFEHSAARANLRRDLSWLRRMLPEDILLVDRLQVDLNPEAEVWVDVHSFEATITAVQQHAHPPDDLCDKCAQTLAKAVSLYEADFMAGFSLADSEQFVEWQFFQREEYRQKMVRMLRQLIGWSQEQQQFEQGIEYGRRWLALDPWHEPAHRALMTFYALTEQQAAALRQYDECVQLLEEELGIEPEPETTA